MTSAAQKPNSSDVPKPGTAASSAARASDGAASGPGNGATGGATGNGAASTGAANASAAESTENGLWSAVKPSENFDDYAAEEHASKVFALWEIAPSLAEPATGASQGATEPTAPVAGTSLPLENDVWAAAGATERMDSPPIAAHQAALAQAAPTSVARASRPVAQTRMSPMLATTTSSADVTGALPALPESRSTRNVLLGAAALVGVLVIGGGIAMFSGAAPSAAVATPEPVTAAPVATPPAAAPPRTVPAASAPAAVVAPAVVEPAVVEPAVIAVPEVVEPPVVAEVAPAPVVVAPVAPEPPPPTLRRLRIRTIPASATLQVDGQTVANPYDGRLADGSTHALIVRAEGHVESTQTIELASDRELTLRLERIAPPRPTPVARAERATPARAARAERRAARRPASTVRPREPEAAGAGFVTESPY